MNVSLSNRGHLRLLLGMVLALSSLIAVNQHAAAQQSGLVDESTYIVGLTGDQVEWTSPWLFDEEFSVADPDFELISLSTPASTILLAYFPPDAPLEDARDLTLDGLAGAANEYTQLDRGSNDSMAYALDIASMDVVDLAIFSLLIDDGDAVVSLLYQSPLFLFESGIEDAQGSITINGTPLYDGIAAADLQEVIDTQGEVTVEEALGGLSVADPNADAPPTTPEVTPEVALPDDELETTPTPDLTLPDDELDATLTPDLTLPDDELDATPTPDLTLPDDELDATPTPDLTLPDDELDATPTPDLTLPDDELDATPTPDPVADELDPSHIALGVVEEGLYQSLQFGTEVTWDTQYALDVDHEAPVSSSSGSGATDQLNLIWNEPGRIALLEIQVFEDDWTGADYVDHWTSEGFMEAFGPTAEILLVEETGDRGGVVVLDELNSGQPILAYHEVIVLDDGRVALLTLIGDDADFAEAVDDATAGVTVDGEPVFSEFDGDEIQVWLDF